MFVYIITIFAALLSFMALLSSLRFLFTRQALFWIVPLFISAILLYQNITSVLFYGETIENRITLAVLLPAFLSLFWYALVVIFHYTLKLAIPENKYINDSRKNLKEALYIEKYERRKSKRERETFVSTISGKSEVPNIPSLHNGKLVE